MMLNLVPAIRAIEKQVAEIKARHRMELREYEDSLDSLMDINEACLKCAGTGTVFSRSCAEDEGDYYPCRDCGGTGKRRTDNG